VTFTARWLDHPPAAWSSLLASDPSATPIHRAELARAFAAVLPGYSAHWIAVECDGALVGGAPAMIERRAGLHWIHAMPLGLPGTPLALSGKHGAVDQAVAVALDQRAAELRAVGGEWVIYRPEGPDVEPEAQERVPGETRSLTTSVLDLGGGIDAAYRALARRTRKDMRTPRARQVTCAEDPHALEETYALYRAQARQWPGHRARPLELLRRLLMGASPAARLFTARDERGLLAGILALIGDREWTLWWSGSHSEARPKHALVKLFWWSAERAAAAGCTRLNLGASVGLASVAVFKLGFGARDLPVTLRWFAPVHAGVVGRAVAGLRERIRARRARGESG
jgi:hypothetical protein